MRIPPAALAILLLTAAIPAQSSGADGSSPEPAWTIESAQARLRYLKDQEERIGEWVDGNWEKELSKTNPGLVTGPRRKGEKEADYKARDLQRRLAASDVKDRLRKERLEWIRKERAALLASEIRELIPARLGPYDAGKDDYPLALGFGWPSELSVRFRVPKENRKIFELRYASRLPARFRLNEQGETYLLSLGKFWKESDRVTPIVSVAPPGPRQLWEGAHASWVTSVSFRPDGEQVLSVGADGTIIAWDAVTGHRAFLLDNAELALSVAYSPDGTTFATGGADSLLRLRGAGDGRELWSLSARGRILAVAFSPDGRYIATGDGSGMAVVWDVASRRETATVDLKAPVWSVAFTGGGNALLAGGEGNAVVLWSLLYNRQTWRKELEWPVYSVAVAREPGLVAVGGGGNRMLVLRERDGSVEWSADMGGEVRSVGFDPSGGVLGGGGAGYDVRVFTAVTGRPRWTATIGNPVRSLSFGPGGTRLAVGSSDFSVRVFEAAEEDRVVAAYWSPGRVYLKRGEEKSLFRP
ncbi:MAG TPA: PQQ-binding-like beta-propeller repeat protein [Candidatus Deferrimicrobiaceae bacterium]